MTIRFASAEDLQTIYQFIKELADYEREPEGVKITPEALCTCLVQKRFECILVEEGNVPVGFALFCENFHTWVGPVMWLDDIYVREECRGKGYGKMLFQELGKIAQKRGYARIEWRVFNWNKPAINFYEKLGANALSEWITYRLNDL